MKVYFLVANERFFSKIFDQLHKRFSAQKFVIPSARHATTKAGIVSFFVSHELFYAFRLLVVALTAKDGVVLVSSVAHYSALLASRLASLLGQEVRVYLFNFYIHSLGRMPLVQRILGWLLTSRIAMMVNSPRDLEYFASLSPRADIRYAPFCMGEIATVPPHAIELGDYVFAGGYTNRDYDTLLTVAENLNHVPFVVVCSPANRLPSMIPGNVRVLRDVQPEVFHTLLAGSRCVVVPLKEDTGASGHMVALAAMQFGKLVLYADYPTVGQYFIDGETGVSYRPGEPDDLREKLVRCLADLSKTVRIGAAARDVFYQRFSNHQWYGEIVTHVSEWICRPSGETRMAEQARRR